ncbi:MAG: DUF4105 domain-containing protein [Candidatus Eisenbacteria bacterium]|nr:DUF4105 domain-containing protein [Candidatus Eisenbacteria bacterium]
MDDPKFFLDPRGSHDPRAELHATVRSFFSTAPADTSAGTKSPICRFIARYTWLKDRLSIDEAKLPTSGCEEFEDLIEQIKPESATLIFPTSFVNSPASMYGHTLLTIETATKSKLLSYAINYSALTSGAAFAPFYIAKGLLGGYPGYFSILPYYAKLQEYSDVNDRDIWEYPLTLDRQEVLRLVMHTYEMENIYSDYKFFSENCSYDLLFLIEAARPSAQLTNRFGSWVIPLDTIREVGECGLLSEPIYRPSKSTKVSYLIGSLPPPRRREALDVALGRRSAREVLDQQLDHETKIRVSDLAIEYLQYKYTKGDLAKAEYLPRFLSTLEARSGLGAADEWRYSIPPPPRPDGGHRSNRLAFRVGTTDGAAFQELRVRPAYHALLDHGAGYKPGSQIVFCDLVARYFPERRSLRLEGIDLIDIVSIAPRDQYFKHLSWKVHTGFLRPGLDPDRDHLVYGLRPAVGLGHQTRALGLSYLMLDTDLQVGGALRKSYSVGGGLSAGLHREIRPWWRAQATASYLRYPWGDTSQRFAARFEQNFTVRTNFGLSLAIERRADREESRVETQAGGSAFF